MSRWGVGTFSVAAVFLFGVLEMIFNHAVAQLHCQRHRVHARHGDMSGIQHQPDIFGLGVFHDVHGLMLILDLAAQMGMDAELHAQFLTDAAAQKMKRDGDLLEIVGRRAVRLVARASIGFLMITAKAAREAGHVEVIVHHRLALGRIMKGNAAARRAAGDGGELAADLIHAMLQSFPAVGIIDLALGARTRRDFPAVAARPGLRFVVCRVMRVQGRRRGKGCAKISKNNESPLHGPR